MFYDGTKLLSMKDLSGKTPEIYISTSNRSAGKTTYFNRLVVNRFKKDNKKFCLLYRFNYELDDCALKFFSEIKDLFFKNDEMISKSCANGKYHELYLNSTKCGYAIALNDADFIKKYSHLFHDVDCMLFDEFQSETGHYCSREVQKLISIHTSIARGGGKQVRYVPIYMISNCVSMLNPYYNDLGIATRLNDKVNFLKGEGWVLENGFNASASQLQKDSAFNRAFSNNNYVKYSTENVYLNDSTAFIEKMLGKCKYICTLKFENNYYSIKEYSEQGIIYCDDSYDPTFPRKIALTTDDHQINYVMLKNNDLLFNTLKDLFKKGCFRFKNLSCKNVVIKALLI